MESNCLREGRELIINGEVIPNAKRIDGDFSRCIIAIDELERLISENKILRMKTEAYMNIQLQKKNRLYEGIDVEELHENLEVADKKVEYLEAQLSYYKRCNETLVSEYQNQLDKQSEEILCLKRQLDNYVSEINSWGTSETSEELTKLRAIVNAYEERRANNRKAREGSLSKARQKGLEVRQHKSREQTARILVLTLKGYSVREVISVMYEDYSAEVKQGNIYRLLSVKEDTDRERILSIYDDFKDLFKDITKEELISWFNSERINKLHLISKEQLIRRIGINEFNAKCLIPDEYVDGEFYKI